MPKDATPPNFAEKTFANIHKTVKFAKVFFRKSFPLYDNFLGSVPPDPLTLACMPLRHPCNPLLKILATGLLLYQIITLQNTPSQPTPASAEWRQLCDEMGLLGHSNSWLEVEVQWTSSRKIGPLPVPKYALLYALPPGHQYKKVFVN